MVTRLPSTAPPLSASSKNQFSRIPDTEEIAGFLLTLKHRSVTPDPHSSDRAQVVSESHPSPQIGSYAKVPETPVIEPQQSNESVDGSQMGPTGELSMPWEKLIGDSKLVSLQDRDLVPDCLFVAMAQMKPCRLQSADRVGCYKSREIGFIGMCCMHCGGQPGFGRYYPNSVRSLAQTTTSQTILKHIGSKCQFCPPEIRDAILELQEHQAIREGFPTGRPRYGSRKIFFQRIWERLHGEETIKAMDAEGSVPQAKSRPLSTVVSKTIPASDTSIESFESQSDDEVARANAHVVATKRPREYAPPEHYFPKRPKFSQWSMPHAHPPHPSLAHYHHYPWVCR